MTEAEKYALASNKRTRVIVRTVFSQFVDAVDEMAAEIANQGRQAA